MHMMTSPVLWHVDNAAALLWLVTACSIGGDIDRAALVSGSTQLQLKATFLHLTAAGKNTNEMHIQVSDNSSIAMRIHKGVMALYLDFHKKKHMNQQRSLHVC